MTTLIKTSSKIARLTTTEMAMYLETAIALAASFALLAMAAWVWYLSNSDWFSSIRRFQEMI